jgi:hypothetical protein
MRGEKLTLYEQNIRAIKVKSRIGLARDLGVFFFFFFFFFFFCYCCCCRRHASSVEHCI